MRYCGECGRPLEEQAPRRREVQVRNYAKRAQMERGLQSMAAAGWKVEGQSGHFSNKPWLFRPLVGDQANRVTVTFVRDR